MPYKGNERVTVNQAYRKRFVTKRINSMRDALERAGFFQTKAGTPRKSKHKCKGGGCRVFVEFTSPGYGVGLCSDCYSEHQAFKHFNREVARDGKQRIIKEG